MLLDYSKAKVYRLFCEGCELVYIGSTIQSLSTRLSKHRFKAFQPKPNITSSKLFWFSIFNDTEVKIELLESYPCNSRKELHERERFYIELYRSRGISVINSKIPFRTPHERVLLKKIWRENNRDYFVKWKQAQPLYFKKWRRKPVMCSCGLSITKGAFSKHRQTLKHIRRVGSL
jgi:GIY-YIG catalytic domain.